LLVSFPQTLQAARYFSADQARLEATKRDLPSHPRQPLDLRSDPRREAHVTLPL
jgi:hypothetical protein